MKRLLLKLAQCLTRQASKCEQVTGSCPEIWEFLGMLQFRQAFEPRFPARRSLAVVILVQKVPPEVTEPAEPFGAGEGRVICLTMTLFGHPSRRLLQVWLESVPNWPAKQSDRQKQQQNQQHRWKQMTGDTSVFLVDFNYKCNCSSRWKWVSLLQTLLQITNITLWVSL